MSKLYFFMGDTPAPTPSLDKREVYWPKSLGTRDYYDPSLKRSFSSKSEMRAYLRANKLRDAGERINPSKHIEGRLKHDPSPKAEAIQRYVQSHGGTEGLLRRIQQGKGNFI